MPRRSATLYAELGFTSLLKDLAVAAPALIDDRTDRLRRARFARGARGIPARPCRKGQETAVWLSLDSEDPDDEGFGTRVIGVEVSTEGRTQRARSPTTRRITRSPR